MQFHQLHHRRQPLCRSSRQPPRRQLPLLQRRSPFREQEERTIPQTGPDLRRRHLGRVRRRGFRRVR